jgi:hypothetical protein
MMQTKTSSKTVEILVNNSPVVVPGRAVTGAEIKTAGHLSLAFTLYDPKGVAVGNDDEIKVHTHERFIAISGQDVS